MSRVDPQRPLLPSLLDRLIDDEPDVSAEPLWRRSYTVRKLMEAVRRDLEALLNSRQPRPELASQEGELRQSSLTYGIPEVLSLGMESPDDRQRLCRAVAQSIRLFEPRLTNIQVKAIPPEDHFTRSIRLTIQAVLYVEPIRERVTFDTLVEPTKGTCEVRVPN